MQVCFRHCSPAGCGGHRGPVHYDRHPLPGPAAPGLYQLLLVLLLVLVLVLVVLVNSNNRFNNSSNVWWRQSPAVSIVIVLLLVAVVLLVPVFCTATATAAVGLVLEAAVNLVACTLSCMHWEILWRVVDDRLGAGPGGSLHPLYDVASMLVGMGGMCYLGVSLTVYGPGVAMDGARFDSLGARSEYSAAIRYMSREKGPLLSRSPRYQEIQLSQQLQRETGEEG